MNDMTKRLSRREAILACAIGATGAAAAVSVSPFTAYAQDKYPESGVPATRVLIRRHESREVVVDKRQRLDWVPVAAGNGVATSLVSSATSAKVDDAAQIAVDFSLPSAAGIEALAIQDEIKEQDIEGIRARVSLAVSWGSDKSTIQIQKGTFSVTQIKPLYVYSNCFYGIMQKTHYLSEVFNGNSIVVETGWPSDPFNPEEDKWTCGGAVGGLITDLVGGEQYDFTVEIYL